MRMSTTLKSERMDSRTRSILFQYLFAGVKATFIHVKAGRVSMTDLISCHISAYVTNYLFASNVRINYNQLAIAAGAKHFLFCLQHE